MADAINTVFLAGTDMGLRDALLPEFETRGWHLEFAGTPEEYVYGLRASVPKGWQTDEHLSVSWLDRIFFPLLLDIDCSDRGELETIRNVKLLFGAIPVIVIGANVDLAALAVARLDGADAFFWKSDLRLHRLSDAVRNAFARVHRWRTLIDRFGKDEDKDAGFRVASAL